MPHTKSPLRYPGGKASLSCLLADLIYLNGAQDGIYVEPFAGGAGAALELLFSEHVSSIVINDLDICIYAFWKSILSRPRQFLTLLEDTPVSIEEWHNQHRIYCRPRQNSRIRLGFATFFLNRCNRSGILGQAGPIGGYQQDGNWRLDARFNKNTLRKRIERILDYRDRISVYNLDALTLLQEVVEPLSASNRVFAYLDPPYYHKGPRLYLNAYEDDDHLMLARYIGNARGFEWAMTYDDTVEIRRMYEALRVIPFRLVHTAYKRRAGKEVLITPCSLQVPPDFASSIHKSKAVQM